MARARDMQGVSAQLTTLKSDGVRRHKARCIFIVKPEKICDCPHNLAFYRSSCGGASKCPYYEEANA